MNDERESQSANPPEPTESDRITVWQRALAGVCKVCPFCVAARRWPDSKFSRFWRQTERHCPFCRAYQRTHSR